MNRFYYTLFVLLFVMPMAVSAQSLKFSDFEREDSRDMNFEIIGKMNNRILVYKDIKWKHKIAVFDDEMNTLGIVNLDFIPEKTFHIDFVAYPDFFYMIYQYQKGKTLHCMAVKMDANIKKMEEPIEVDTTQIAAMADNKIYSTISSEDKQRIMIFKIQALSNRFAVTAILFDNHFKMINKNRLVSDYDERRERYDNFLLGNDGSFAFTFDKQLGYRDNSSVLYLVTKAALEDTFSHRRINLDKKYINEVKLKIDNLNNRYIINTFYCSVNRGSIEGLFTYIGDRDNGKNYASEFTPFYDALRAEANRDGAIHTAFDNFYIRQVVVKKDGGFILTAEDFTSEEQGYVNSWNRYNYLYNPNALSSGAYYYSPYSGYYRPLSSFNSYSIMYYYENILVLSISKSGKTEWSKIIQKDQNDDNDDNFMSFSTMNSGGELHFLFNTTTKNQVISDQSVTPTGILKRNATLKTLEKGYEFMPRYSKQIGANQIIIPCTFRNNICFAKADF